MTRSGRLALVLITALSGAVPVASRAAAAGDATKTEQTATDQRIEALHSALAITAAQTPEWTVFTQAMRDDASATDTLFRNRAASAASMNALDNMRSYATVARAYADNTQKLSDAFAALYGTLDETQKHTADTLFRDQAQKQAAAAQGTTKAR